MATLKQYFDFAQLAQAAYALFWKFPTDPKKALIEQEGGLSDKQAGEFLKSYTVVDTSANPNDAYGFSATLFQSNATGEITLAIRGTEPSAADASGSTD